ncbi:hypothetical protein [Halomonas ventosae]|uniref:Uncharacterized protein n=1 Tax=Halomonas ventosae TaxID=229007 RepID=A0A2T0VNV4_9GAMM|nr:hypothetical protein [Halomonas ventosae]PRY72057.1 hypothetical protein BCL64_105200 [Halomonas ventosae]
MKTIYGSIALASISLILSNPASSNEALPESFSEYSWLLDGAREVISRETEFAPTTTCFNLNREFTGENTSSIQKERAWKEYNGKLIPLTGVVEEVKKIPLTDDYLAYFKCTNSESFLVDFTVRIPNEMKEYAFELTPGDRENVYVRLTDYGEMVGVSTELDTFSLERGNWKTCFAYLKTMSRSPNKYEYSCFGDEEKTGFGSLIKGAGVSQTLGALVENDRTITFTVFPENPRIYVAQIKNNSGKDNYYSYSGNEDACAISTNYVEEYLGSKENQTWLKENYNEIKTVILETEGLENLNDWYIKNYVIINNLSDEKYECEQKQLLRLLVHIAYQKALEEGGLDFINEQRG